MTTDNRSDLGKILKQRRLMIPLSLRYLAAQSGVSVSHVGRIEKGERFPSARVLRKIAKPLGFAESELFSQAGFLSPKPPVAEGEGEHNVGQLDPYVQRTLSQEPVEVQRTVIGVLSILKSIARGNDFNIEFAEYARRKYPEVDEDLITMIEDILEHPPGEGVRKARIKAWGDTLVESKLQGHSQVSKTLRARAKGGE